MRLKKSTVIVSIIIFIGIALLLYPTVSNMWNLKHQSQAIGGYVTEKKEVSKSDYEKIILRAERYNDKLSKKSNDRFILNDNERNEYNEYLKIPGTDVMSLVEIPKLNLKLPIYHGTDEAVLQVAIGHIAGTSLPIGGKGTHSVISGHTGLKSARLFTDIDKLVAGDIFTIETLDEKMTYEVDQTSVVLPGELDNLSIDESKDYVTLQTCTPYGVNTHRLLVRGSRINTDDNNTRIVSDLIEINKFISIIIISISFLLLILLIEIVKYLYKKI